MLLVTTFWRQRQLEDMKAMERRFSHETPPLAVELLTSVSCYERGQFSQEFIFY